MSFLRSSPRQVSLGLAALRVAVATIFIRHGRQKLFALGFVCDMLVAIVLVRLNGGFSSYELEFLLLSSSLAIALTGSGMFSVGALLAGRLTKLE